MAKNTSRSSAQLHRLTARQVHQASEGDHADGGGLMLRVRAASASWVLRFTAPSGRRREMGLGACPRGSLAQVGDSLTAARRQAHEAREALSRGQDPIELREQQRAAA